MPLTVYYSDRIDDLAADLQRRLLADPCRQADPFRFTQVVVPNNNIAKWLQTRRFAAAGRLTAGLDFRFIDDFLRGCLRGALAQAGKLEGDGGAGAASDSLASRSLTYAVMRALLDPEIAKTAPGQKLAPFRRYIWPNGDDRQPGAATGAATARLAWQLAGKLAGLLDLYEARRPLMVQDWLTLGDRALASKYDTKHNPVAAAEIALTQIVLGPDGLLPGQSLRQLLAMAVANAVAPLANEGETLYFFGQSTLTYTQAQVLHWLAQKTEVVFYYNNVCLEYWADIERRQVRKWREIRPQLDGDENAPANPAIENRLLNEWGLAGRETVRILCEMEEGNAAADKPWFNWEVCPADDAGGAPAPDTVLAALQMAIRHRTSDIENKLPQDSSLQIFGAPGIRREVETVHNAIIAAATGANGKATPISDIAVLVPDMKTYRPYLEAVFSERGEIPCSIVDATAADFSRCLAGLNALFALWRDGLNRDTLFALLDNPLAQAALGCTPDDVHAWRDLTANLGAFAYFDRDDAARRGADDDGAANYAWQAALQRLRLAAVAADLPPDAFADAAPAANVLCSDEGLRFSAIVELLWRELVAAFGPDPATPPLRESWGEVFRRLIAVFLAPDSPRLDPRSRELETGVRGHVLRTLAALDAAELPAHGPDFALEAVNAFAGSVACDRGGYLTGGVTVAGLLPMRPVPFKLVFVLGLGEGRFPGTRAESTLDLRMLGLGTKVRDAALPEINRFLFLETLMATRERLVLSYVNLDPAKDAELYPCGVIRQLEDFLKEAVLLPGTKLEDLETRVPLLEADMANAAPATAAGLGATFYPPARRLARERATPPAAAPDGAPAAPRDVLPIDQTTLDATTLAAFLKSPLDGLLNRHFGIAREYYRSQTLAPETPLAMDTPVFWDLQLDLLKTLAADPANGAAAEAKVAATQALFAARQRQGQAPAGAIGAYELRAKLEKTNVPDAFLALYRQAAGTNAPSATGGDGATAQYDTFLAGSLAIGGGSKQNPERVVQYPPHRLFADWLEWLERLAGDAPQPRFTALVFDFAQASAVSFTWAADAAAARACLTALRDECANYLARPDGPDGTYLTWDYADVAEAWAKAGQRWQGAAVALLVAADNERGGNANDGYHPDLVIEKTLARHRLSPAELADAERDELAPPLAQRLATLYARFVDCAPVILIDKGMAPAAAPAPAASAASAVIGPTTAKQPRKSRSKQ